MPSTETQIWNSARLTIERRETPTEGTVFRLSGPFTARDIYNSLSPDAYHNIFDAPPSEGFPHIHILDLTEVPYMDSIGLGMLASHYVRCQSKGIQLRILGVSFRVRELLKITKMDSVLPIVHS